MCHKIAMCKLPSQQFMNKHLNSSADVKIIISFLSTSEYYKINNWSLLISQSIISTCNAALLSCLLFQRLSQNATMQAKVRPPINTTNTPPTLLRPKAAAPLSWTSCNK